MAGTLLVRWITGSHAYGVTNEDSDLDYVEVYAEPPSNVTGLFTTKTRQTVGTTDVTTYGLRSWAGLVAKGNPNMVETLFIEPEYLSDIWQDEIESVWRSFISRSAGYRFAGYARGQINALAGEKNKKTNRAELVEKYGYDTKWAYHAIRILSEGIQLMNTGRIEFPLADREYLHGVRTGQYELADLLDECKILLQLLEGATERSKLPESPDLDKINDRLHRAYTRCWQ